MQRFWVQSFPDPGRRRIKWRPADRVGYETSTTIPLIPDPVHRRQSIFRGPGVLERVLEELLFCIGLLRVAGLCKKRLRTQFASSTGIFKYNNDIHATANDVTKGLIGPC